LFVLVALGVAGTVDAKQIALPEDHLTVEVPDDWETSLTPLQELTAVPKPVLSAGNRDQAQCMLMVCENTQGFAASDPVLLANLKANVNRIAAAHGHLVTFIADQDLQLNGVPAHVTQYTLAGNGSVWLCRFYSMVGNGRLYLVRTQAAGADQDQALDRIAASLHFDSPPTMPVRPWGRRKIAMVAALCLLAVGAVGGVSAWLLYRPRA
jgi:hypothetical protein